MIVLVHHRAANSPSVYVGPFVDGEEAAAWLDTIPVPSFPWSIIRLQDPADERTPDWNAP